MWPLYLEHDMRHIHFAYGHARGVAHVFRSARGKYTRRFILMGAMYEGVDTVQYGHEVGIAKYFSEKMQMGLEDSLLWIAKAPKEELDRIVSDAMIEISMFETQLRDYVPPIKEGYGGHGVTGLGLDQELMEYVQTSMEHVADSTNAAFTNYHRSAPDHGGSTWDKDYAHWQGMRNMPSPQNSRAGANAIPQGAGHSTTQGTGWSSRSFSLRGLLNHFRWR
jgi:hypothetical protein